MDSTSAIGVLVLLVGAILFVAFILWLCIEDRIED